MKNIDYSNARRWINYHYKDIRLGIFVITAAIIILLLIVQNNRISNQGEKLEQLLAYNNREAVRRSATTKEAIAELKKDNAQQTLIICTIVKQNTFTTTAKVRKICKQDILNVNRVTDDEPIPNKPAAKPSDTKKQSKPKKVNHKPTNQENNSQSLLNCKVDLLGFHIGC